MLSMQTGTWWFIRDRGLNDGPLQTYGNLLPADPMQSRKHNGQLIGNEHSPVNERVPQS